MKLKEKGQKLKICAKKARAANKRRVAFLAKIATRWIYFIHIFRQLLVPNLSKSEQKNSVLALGAYYTDYLVCSNCRVRIDTWLDGYVNASVRVGVLDSPSGPAKERDNRDVECGVQRD